MRSTRILSGTILALFAFACVGCAPKRIPLDHDLAASIEAVRVVSAIEQDAPAIRVKASQAGAAFGLIGALVDAGVTSSRQSKSDDLLWTLRAAVHDHDFREEFWVALEESTAVATWPGHLVVERVADRAPETKGADFLRSLRALDEDGYLVLETEYFLTPDGVHLAIKTRAKLFVDGLDPEYSNVLTYYSAPLGFGTDGTSVRMWAEDRGAAYRRAVTEGIEMTTAMLQRDLLATSHYPEDPAAPERRFEFAELEGLEPIRLKARVVEERGDVWIVRNSNGYLYAFDRAGVVKFDGDPTTR